VRLGGWQTPSYAVAPACAGERGPAGGMTWLPQWLIKVLTTTLYRYHVYLNVLACTSVRLPLRLGRIYPAFEHEYGENDAGRSLGLPSLL
jgi:hypothetical protein